MCKTEKAPNLLLIITNPILLIVFYFFIFHPPIIKRELFFSLEIVALLIFALLKIKFLKKIISILKIELILIFIITILSALRDSFSGEIVYFDRFIAWAIQSFLVSTIFIYWFEKKNIDIISALYSISLIAAIISTLLFTFPQLDELYKPFDLSSYYEMYERFETRYRAYGIAENLLFTYGYIMGFFAGYSLLLIKKSWLFLFPALLFIFASAINARIGFMALVPFFIYLTLTTKPKPKEIFNTTVAVILFFAVYYLTYDYVKSNFTWALDFFEQIFSKDSDNSTINTLITEFIILPQNPNELLFGTGVSLFGSSINASDVGYILQLYYGGIFLLFFILLFITFTSARLFRLYGRLHWYSITFLFSLIILNFKGFYFAATPGGRLFIFIYIYLVYTYYKKNKNLIFSKYT